MNYKLTVKINPDEHYIHVKGVVENVNCEYLQQIYLNENFNIKSINSQDGKLDFIFDKAGDRPPYDHVSRPVIINSNIVDLYFEYDGVITDTISRVNQINEDLVELACYSGWYPKIFDLSFKFDFEVILELPKGYFVITNGSASIIESSDVFDKYHLKSISNGDADIVIFASNKVTYTKKTNGSFEINSYYSDKMKNIALRKVEQIITGYEILTRLFGDCLLTNGQMHYVYRPFGGWGYKRGNLVIMPEQDTMSEAPSEFDLANSVHIDLHELAHNWWGIASTTSYDWIDEGAAEFSSLTFIKEMFGEKVFTEFVERYITKIGNEVNEISILETYADSPMYGIIKMQRVAA